MRSLYKSSQVGQEDVGFQLIRCRVVEQGEYMCALSTAQYAIPATTDLFVVNTDSLAIRPSSVSAKRVDSGPGLTKLVYASDAPLSAANLSAKAYNALVRSRITTIGQLCALELRDLLWLRNVGKKAVAEVTSYRAYLGAPLAP